jgi:hypothetical protein
MTTTPAQTATAAPKDRAAGAMYRQATERFRHLRSRVRRGILVESLAVVSLVLCAFAVVTFPLDRWMRLETTARSVMLLLCAGVVVRELRLRLWRPLSATFGDEELALAVERQDPGLRQALISSLQFDRDLERGGTAKGDSPELMAAVVDDVATRFSELPFGRALDAGRTRRFGALMTACLLAVLGWGIADADSLSLWARRNLLLSSAEWPRFTQFDFPDIGEGRVRLPQGDPYTVTVAVRGPIPDQVFLHYAFARGETGVEQMSRTGDAEYTLTLESLLEDATLHVEGGDGLSQNVMVEIVERPRIEDVSIRVVYPSYMDKDPEVLPGTEGDIRLLRGSVLEVSGRSHKPIRSATLQIGQGNDNTLGLTVQDDGFRFVGRVEPQSGGLLEINVIDQDDLGSGAPPRMFLRVVEDGAPRVELKLRGISSIVTAQAILPGDLVVKDDYGITSVDAAVRILVDEAGSRAGEGDAEEGGGAGAAQVNEPVPTPDFEPAEAVYGDGLQNGAVRFETIASVDLVQFNDVPDADDDNNRIRPGMLLSLRYGARDNFGPGEPHETFGEELTFRVVSRDKLIQELRRRQVEQRQELERIREDERNALLTLQETMNPRSSDARASQARARFKALARRQQSLGRQVRFVGESYQRILWEYENNRVWEPSKTREIEAMTSTPLADLARAAFPTTSRQVAAFADSGEEDTRREAVLGYEDALRRIDAIIQVMEQTETLAALLEQLRGVIKQQDGAIQAVDEQVEQAATDIFNPSVSPKPGDGDKTKAPAGNGGKR